MLSCLVINTLPFYKHHKSICLIGNDDYTSGPYNVFFERGDTRVFLLIPLLNDDLYEGDEYFNVTIADSLPSGVVRGHPYTANVKIEDDECKK